MTAARVTAADDHDGHRRENEDGGDEMAGSFFGDLTQADAATVVKLLRKTL